MCRVFAYHGLEPCLIEDVLVVPPHSLCKQVHDHYLPFLLHYEEGKGPDGQKEIDLRNKLFNQDGFGMAFYTTGQEQFTDEIHDRRPALFKTTLSPLVDPNAMSLAKNISTMTLLAHIRAASSFSVVNTSNNHPFIFGRYSFVHNGEVGQFNKIKRQMANHVSQAMYELIHGTTDSELTAALFFTFLCENDVKQLQVVHSLEKMRAAMRKTLSLIDTLDEDSRSDLNLIVSGGNQLLAVRYRDHPVEHPPSLYYSTKAGPTLNRKYKHNATGEDHNGKPHNEHAKHVIIASEPITYNKEAWNLIEKNHMVCVDEHINLTLHQV